MAVHTFEGRIAAQPAQSAGELPTRSQLDTEVAAAKNRANHTGTQPAATIDDLPAVLDSRISQLVGAAPGALDTLAELAAALGDDPNFAATVTSQLGDLDARVDTLEAAPGGGGGGHASSVGDGALSTFTVTHDLGSVDVTVEVVRVADGQTVYPVTTRPSANTVTVDFGATVPAAGSHRVLVRRVT